MSDYQILTVEQTAGGGLALRRKNADDTISPAATPVIGTASGFPLILGDAAEGRRFQSVRIPFGPVQAGSGNPSPSNIRKLTPRTPTFYRCGPNLYTGEGDTPNTAYSAQGVIGPSSTGTKLTDHIPVSGESEIVLLAWNGSSSVTYSMIRVGMYDADGNLLNGGTGFYGRSASTGIFTDRIPLIDGTATVRVSFYGQWDLGVYAGSAAESLTLTAPEEAGDVWGGVWDPVTGTLTVTHVLYEFTADMVTRVVSEASGRIKRIYLNTVVYDGTYVYQAGICDKYTVVTSFTAVAATPNSIGLSAHGGNQILINDSNIATVEDVKSVMPVHVCYPLKSPVTYQLTPVQITALEGINTIWADCGPVEIEYIRDTGAAIEAANADTRSMIGEASGETASRSLAVGEYVTVGAALYRVTAAVGQGETLVPGSNVVETTVGAELTGTKTELAAHETDAGEELRILAEIADRTYAGRDLTAVFASEIAQSGGDPWAWIKGRITARNYKGIHVGDWIPYTDTSAAPKTRNAYILGINTYQQYGNTAVDHHIDFWGGLWGTKKPINKANYNNGTSESEHPWLASDAYLYANSLAGKVPSEATANPTLVDVDYTADGIYYYLPDALKAQIKPKRFYLEKRYTAGELLTESPAGGWADLGKIWFPTEYEVYGAPVWGGDKYAGIGSAVQYPFFMGNMNRLAFGRTSWWLLTPRSGNSTHWCYVSTTGNATTPNASYTTVAAPICFRIAQ